MLLRSRWTAPQHSGIVVIDYDLPTVHSGTS